MLPHLLRSEVGDEGCAVNSCFLRELSIGRPLLYPLLQLGSSLLDDLGCEGRCFGDEVGGVGEAEEEGDGETEVNREGSTIDGAVVDFGQTETERIWRIAEVEEGATSFRNDRPQHILVCENPHREIVSRTHQSKVELRPVAELLLDESLASQLEEANGRGSVAVDLSKAHVHDGSYSGVECDLGAVKEGEALLVVTRRFGVPLVELVAALLQQY